MGGLQTVCGKNIQWARDAALEERSAFSTSLITHSNPPWAVHVNRSTRKSDARTRRTAARNINLRAPRMCDLFGSIKLRWLRNVFCKAVQRWRNTIAIPMYLNCPAI